MFTLGSQNREVRGRIDWYDEIKTPLLTSLILSDNGQETLKDRTKILHELTLDRCFDLDGTAKLTEEEEFIQTVVASKKKHAKAKLLIMNFIGLALDDDT